MSNLVPFDDVISFSFKGQQVRTVMIHGKPWFVVADLAKLLGYRDAANAARVLRDHQQGYSEVSTPGGPQQMRICSEQGLYRLILRSNAKNADEVQDWVTDEVLPTINRTGSYSLQPAEPPAPVELTRLELIEIARTAELERLALAKELEATSAELAITQPDAEAWRTLARATGDLSVGDAAKILSRDPSIKIGERRLFTLLGELRWAYRQPVDQRWRPYQKAIETGRLSEIPQSHYHPRTGELIIDPPQIRVTIKGLRWPHQHLGGTEQLKLDFSEVA